jgi:hypothetical protein
MATPKKQVKVYLAKAVQVESGADPILGTQELDADLAKELIDSGLAVNASKVEESEK